MNKRKKRKLTPEEIKMMNKMDDLLEEVYKHPEIVNTEVPESLWVDIKRDIDEYEAEQKAAREQKEREELIRLGLIYQKKRKYRKYYVLAAVLVMTMAFGITSFGGPEKIFEMLKGSATGREQTYVDSNNDIKEISKVDEEKIYTEMEEKLGFRPVKLDYLPNGVELLEASVYDEIQGINMYYGMGDKASIIYTIRPNYRTGSWAKDIEDEWIEEYKMELSRVTVYVEKYKVEDGSMRWVAFYEYNDISYSLILLGMEKEEVEKVIQNLYFGKN